MDQNPKIDQILQMDQNTKTRSKPKMDQNQIIEQLQKWIKYQYKKGSTPKMDQNPIMDQILKMDQNSKNKINLQKWIKAQ